MDIITACTETVVDALAVSLTDLPKRRKIGGPIAGGIVVIQFVLHHIVDAVAVHPGTGCIYLDHNL